MLPYRYEIQQRMQTTRPRGAGAERRGGRNCGTYHGETWKQRATTNDEAAALDYVRGLGNDWRVVDHAGNVVLDHFADAGKMVRANGTHEGPARASCAGHLDAVVGPQAKKEKE